MRGQALHIWPGGFRVQDCAITPDGRRLIAADVKEKIHVYNFITHEEEYCLPMSSKPTSVAMSRDSRHMLVNLSEGEIQLIDIDTTDIVRRFEGQKQGHFVIRSTFGGAAENFVVSGSEGIFFFRLFSISVTNFLSRFTCLRMAQRKWDSCRDFGRAHFWLRELDLVEPHKPRHVCFCRG